MALSGAVVRAALAAVGALGGQMRDFDQLAAGAEDALRQAPAGLTPDGAASFLADKAQESAYFRTTTEYGKNLRYDPYRGRGFQMVTWRENYAKFGAWCHGRDLVDDPNVFVKNPATLSDYRWAWLTGVWYFEAHGLWARANRGDHLWVSQAVNGGLGRAGTSFVPNHWRERDAMFRAFRLAGSALLPSRPAHAAQAVVTPPVPTRRTRSEDTEMYKETPEPAEGTAKIDWPRTRFVYGFDPIGGWGGKCILRVNFGPRGGWLHLARWWIRLPDWTANNRSRMKVWDHPVGAQGTDFAIGADWETAPPARASSIELDLSAPDGVHIFMVYEK